MNIRGVVGLVLALATSCGFSPDNPALMVLPDAGSCGTTGVACCPRSNTTTGEPRSPCRSASLTCLAGTCVPCGAAGQRCCADPSTDGGAGSVCNSAGLACLSGSCVDCSGPERAVCSGRCISITTDQNCGACGATCATAAGERCTRGATSGVDGGVQVASCLAFCQVGETLCGSVCRDITDDPANCGACNNRCVSGQSCVRGVCTTVCPTGQTACSGTCRALQSDNTNCGACGNVCPGGTVCSAGACTTTCSAAQTNCSGTCRDLATDNANCGVCGRACTGGTSCQGRSCACPTGQTACSGTCRALQTDNNNCGICGRVCGGGTVCSAGVCTSTCAAPTTNCSGVCRDLQNDANHCGACGRACTRTNGVAGCASGACALAACNSGFGNCDGVDANGCEVNTGTSVSNCGVCGNTCQLANAAASCVAGRCTRGTCVAGFANCDGIDSNGCEVNTVAGDINNCGACNNRCPTPPIGSVAVCANSMCTTSSVSCSAGTADCDGAPGNGCEVATTTVSNCGACGRACVGTNGTATCTSQLCGINCGAGFGNCNGLLSDGCETNTTTSPTNCGACNTVCSLANATAGCAAGACTIASCNAGFANCDGAPGNGCERNLNSDTNNCGACGNVCAGGQLCSAGVCVTTCGSGQTNCSSVCRDLTTDPDACGACGTVCSGTGIVSRTCGGSACSGTCAAGRANCDANLQTNGCETDINTSVATCGGCAGMACSTNHILPACTGGNCTGSCFPSYYADCNSDKRADGCEVNTRTDPLNCGGCGAVCPTRQHSTPVCSTGSCGMTCEAAWGDCDGSSLTGCELRLDVNGNCGACGVTCSGGTTCQDTGGGAYACR
ncbi:MAG: hypothetical protein KA978_20935 [Deltaproteobacteria bacterium]|nr:hypothetical protein [Deltaproteobacteria bacterium]